MDHPLRAARVTWLAGGVALALLAWQGHHVAHWLPQLEREVAELGPWGPAALIGAILLLGPLLVPDSIFGITAGASFGLGAGAAYYFIGLYLMCLLAQLAGRHWLKAGVLRRLDTRPGLRAAVAAAPQGGTRFTFLVRLVPVNQALLSYALGAADVPLRFAVLGNAGMLVHMFPTVYFGAAAVHLTRMAGAHHRVWESEGVLLLVGLGASVFLAIQITRRAWAAIAAEGQDGPGVCPDSAQTP